MPVSNSGEKITHRRTGTGTAQIFVLFLAYHVGSPELAEFIAAVEYSVNVILCLPVPRVNVRGLRPRMQIGRCLI